MLWLWTLRDGGRGGEMGTIFEEVFSSHVAGFRSNYLTNGIFLKSYPTVIRIPLDKKGKSEYKYTLN